MPELTLSLEAMRYITAAEDAVLKAAQKQIQKGERLPRTGPLKIHIRDCVEDTDRLFFVVDTGQLGLALGRGAKNLQTLKSMFKKEVKFIEYHDEVEVFLRNLFKPFTVESVAIERIPRSAYRRRPPPLEAEEEGSPTGLDDTGTVAESAEGAGGEAAAPAEPATEAAPEPEPAAEAAAEAAPEEELPEEILVARVTVKQDDKGKAIGKGGKNIKVARLIAKRHHELWDVQVL